MSTSSAPRIESHWGYSIRPAPPSIGWTGRRPLVPHRVALFLLLLHERSRTSAHGQRSHARIRRTHARAPCFTGRGDCMIGWWGWKYSEGEVVHRDTWWGGKQVESRARHHADRTCLEEVAGEDIVVE